MSWISGLIRAARKIPLPKLKLILRIALDVMAEVDAARAEQQGVPPEKLAPRWYHEPGVADQLAERVKQELTAKVSDERAATDG